MISINRVVVVEMSTTTRHMSDIIDLCTTDHVNTFFVYFQLCLEHVANIDQTVDSLGKYAIRETPASIV